MAMQKQLTTTCIIGMFLVVVLSGCFEEKKENENEHNEIEDYAEIHMEVPGNLKLVENVSFFNMVITNPLNATMLIHDCFSLEKYSQENETFEFIARFENINGQFFIDLFYLSENYGECGNINLSSKETLNYNFTIKNAEEGIYKIAMAKAIMLSLIHI